MYLPAGYEFEEEWYLTQRVTMAPEEFDFWFVSGPVEFPGFELDGYMEAAIEGVPRDANRLVYQGKAFVLVCKPPKSSMLSIVDSVGFISFVHCNTLLAFEHMKLVTSKSTALTPFFES